MAETKLIDKTGIIRLITLIGNAIKAKYTKPNTGIPKTDLDSSVQTSLGKADTAIQSSDITGWAKKGDLVAIVD